MSTNRLKMDIPIAPLVLLTAITRSFTLFISLILNLAFLMSCRAFFDVQLSSFSVLYFFRKAMED